MSTDSPQIDFTVILFDLRIRAGLSRNAIAMHANLPRTSVFNYENGVTPLHPIGERLIECWCAKFAMTRAQLPRKLETRMSNASRTSFPSVEKL